MRNDLQIMNKISEGQCQVLFSSCFVLISIFYLMFIDPSGKFRGSWWVHRCGVIGCKKTQSLWTEIITKLNLKKWNWNILFSVVSLFWSELYRSISDLTLFSLNYVRRTVQLKAFTGRGFYKTVPGVELWARRPSTAQVHHQHALAQPFHLFSFTRTNLLFLAAGALTVGGCVLFCQLRALWSVLRFYTDA